MKKIRWLKIADGEIGQTEIAGEVNNPRIVEYLDETKKVANVSDEIAWCSAFVNWVMAECGFRGTKSLLARDWLEWGRQTKKKNGAIVVLKRGTDPHAGHVGFYVGDGSMQDGKQYIKVLGGNQSNMVRVSEYLESRVLGFRWPLEFENLAAAGDVRMKNVAQVIVAKLPEVKVIENPRPWYRKHGFKRALGFLLSGATIVLMLFPHTHAAGVAFGAMAAPTLTAGFYDAKQKKKNGVDQSDSVWRSVLKIIVQLLTKYIEK